jgi:hypothetical protein
MPPKAASTTAIGTRGGRLEWHLHEIAYAGRGSIGEDDYTGSGDRSAHANVLYISTDASPRQRATQQPSDGRRHHELFRGVTNDLAPEMDAHHRQFNNGQPAADCAQVG